MPIEEINDLMPPPENVASPLKKTNWSQMSTLITIFFFWGFVAASNAVLIPVFKKAFNLTQVKSQMVDSAFYIAYFVGSIIYFIVSRSIGGDVLNKIGYKKGLVIGLIISALGTLMFYPAANPGHPSFPLMLTGLFIVGLGFSLQQIAANPLAIAIGDAKTGAQRLCLGGGVNNFGTTIGPLIVSYAIFGSVSMGNTVAKISSVKVPYLILGAAFLIVAVIIQFSSIPNKIEAEIIENEPNAEAESYNVDTVKTKTINSDRPSVFNYPQLLLGMLGIFVYVGVEASTVGNLPEYLHQHFAVLNGSIVSKSLNLFGAKEFTNNLNAPFISLYWASLMMGRWTGAIGAFDFSGGLKKVLPFIVPYLAFFVFLIVNKISGQDITPFYLYAVVIVAMIVGDILSKGSPAKMLLLFASMGVAALIIGMFTTGIVSIYALISAGLFCSTLWPCIFTLSVAGLGRHTNEGSSLLVMMILGGALIPPLQGWIADNVSGIQTSFIVGVVCFAYLAFFAIRAKSILKAQGIDYDHKATGGGH